MFYQDLVEYPPLVTIRALENGWLVTVSERPEVAEEPGQEEEEEEETPSWQRDDQKEMVNNLLKGIKSTQTAFMAQQNVNKQYIFTETKEMLEFVSDICSDVWEEDSKTS